MRLFFSFVYNFYKDQKKYFLANVSLSLLNSFSKICIPIYLKIYVDAIGKNSSIDKVLLSIFLFFLLIILNGLLNVLWHTLNTRIGADLLSLLREKIMFILENADYKNLLNINREKLKHIIYSDTLEVFRVAIGVTSNIISGLFVLGMVFTYLFINQKTLFCLTLMMFLIGIFLSTASRKKISHLSSTVNESMKKISAFCNLFIDGLPTNRNQNLSAYFKKKHKDVSKEFKHKAVNSDFALVFLKSSIENLNYVFSMVFITYFFMAGNNNDLGNTVLMVYYTNILISYSQSIETLLASISTSMPAFEQINLILSIPVENKNENEMEIKRVDSVSTKNISYSYSKDRILDDLSFELNQGDRVLVKGKNGTGKTTLLNIISGLIVPDSGLCLVNGIPYKKINKKTFRDKMLFISHEDILLEEDICSYLNISLKKVISLDDIGHLFKDMGTSSIQNYQDLILDPYGCNLSAGEKKKILLMKTLLGIREFDIIVVDELDANLDVQTKDYWKRAKWNLISHLKNKIYIEVSHNSNDEQFYNKIIIL